MINDEFTIFSNDCFAGQVYHIMGKQFKSPTVNCFIRPIDFVKFLENVDWYLNQELIEVESSLPFENKVLLTVNKHEGIECEKILKYKNDECCVGVSAQIQNILVDFCLNILRIGIIYHG